MTRTELFTSCRFARNKSVISSNDDQVCLVCCQLPLSCGSKCRTSENHWIVTSSEKPTGFANLLSISSSLAISRKPSSASFSIRLASSAVLPQLDTSSSGQMETYSSPSRITHAVRLRTRAMPDYNLPAKASHLSGQQRTSAATYSPAPMSSTYTYDFSRSMRWLSSIGSICHFSGIRLRDVLSATACRIWYSTCCG